MPHSGSQRDLKQYHQHPTTTRKVRWRGQRQNEDCKAWKTPLWRTGHAALTAGCKALKAEFALFALLLRIVVSFVLIVLFSFCLVSLFVRMFVVNTYMYVYIYIYIFIL